MNSTLKSHLALIIANLIYGINYTVAKDVMPDYIQPFGFIFIRVSGALLLFWLIHAVIYTEKIARKDLLLLAVYGFFGVASNQLLFFKGLSITTPINAAIIMTTNPILVLVMSAIILRERIGWSKVAGIALGMTGAISLIVFREDFRFGSETLPGDLMILLNAASYGIYLVLVKPLMKKYQPVTVIKWVFLFGFMVVIPFGWQEFTLINWQDMPAVIWWEAAFVVIGTTFIAYFLSILALKNLSASVVSSYIYLQPVFAAMIALYLGSDELDWLKFLSALLIFTGVYMVSRPVNSRKSANH